ncbi:MAG: enoyl-CoA hydratase/isomerase family protein [Pseudomonadota bacterium]
MANHPYQTLHYAVVDSVAEIELDRPPVNVIDESMTLEYFDALARADQDSSVKVITLSGRGKGLSAGVDIRILEDFGQAEMERFVRTFYIEMLERVRGLSKPIIAAVHGFAREGACTMAIACDMIIASDDATFGYPGVPHLAAPPGMHVWHLQRLLGRPKAAEIIFTGEPISALEAERGGLVTRVVPRDSLQSETRALARKLADMSPLALRRTRELLYAMEDMRFEDVPEAAVRAISEAFASNDSKEARRAFNEKRKPIWTGT